MWTESKGNLPKLLLEWKTIDVLLNTAVPNLAFGPSPPTGPL